MGFQADMRAAAVAMLEAYGTASSLKLQVYPARPRSIAPPTAFVDGLSETLANLQGSVNVAQRTVTANVIVLWTDDLDSKQAANQKDAFVDGFVAYVLSVPHQAGANTLIWPASIEDLPDFVPEWQPPAEQKTYYATRIELEGYAQG